MTRLILSKKLLVSNTSILDISTTQTLALITKMSTALRKAELHGMLLRSLNLVEVLNLC
jgi:hypothetical protein